MKLLISAILILSGLFVQTNAEASPSLKSKCKEHFKEGQAFFKLRAKGADDWRAKSKYIDSAIYHFKKSLNCTEYRQRSAYYYLRSLHFKGMYTSLPDEQRKRVYNEAKLLGEQLTEEYPEDVGIKLWYLASAGKWIQYYGIFRAAYDGLGPRIKANCEKIVELDPLYENGIGFRMLGLVYYMAPYIPVVLTWPDKEKGIALTQKSLSINPDNIGNLLFMGKMYYLDEQYEKAIYYLKKCRAQNPREDYLIMERFDQMKAKHFLDLIQSQGFGQ